MTWLEDPMGAALAAPVAELRVHRVPARLVRPFVTAVRRADTIDLTLIEVIDANGRSGWGEAAVSWRVTGESPESVTAVVAGPIANAVIGRPPHEIVGTGTLAGSVWGNAAARSAVDWALADLAAGQHGAPLVDALARELSIPAPRRRVRTDMTLSAGEPVAVADAAAEHAAAGFGTLKIKAQAGTRLRDVLVAVRAAVGGEVVLRIDANQAWTVADAIREIRACEDAGVGIELVEQPVQADDLEGMAAVRAAVTAPILADESARTARDVQRIAELGAADFVNVKLAKTGGVGETLATVDAARTAGLGVIVGCMLEGSVGVSSAATLAAAIAPDLVHDLDGGLWLRDAVVAGGAAYEQDKIVLPEAAGLGIRHLVGIAA